jgi:DNA-binding beta-propeller fold protein YncE
MSQARITLVLIFFLIGVSVRASESFVNFETTPVHPLALSPDGKTLAVCNLPAARVELFDVSGPTPRLVASVFTGIDPVSARFNAAGELWVANHISDSISIIDLTQKRVIFTLDAFDGPADIVFTPDNHAFVSHSGANVVQIWDVARRVSLGSIDIDGDRPKAMAISKDGSEIYVAILESGNGSTIIAPNFAELDHTPQPSAADLPEAPNHGLNPAPNFGDIFSPGINPKIPATNLPPRVSLIVRKQNGRWMDDHQGDWTEYISGTNAFLTGRVQGWDTADHDIAVITATNGAVRYIRGLMNICFDVAVNPASGQIALIGTDAINEVRFEPVLQSIFARMKLALVNPTDSTSQIKDLNPHLDYIKRTLPVAERRQSVGDPRGIAWNSRGTRAYVTGMGSNNILMLDENGARIGAAVELPDGPTGVVVDDARNRIYVFCRFAAKVVTLDAETLAIQSSVLLFDPTPEKIRVGRKHFYNTSTSGLGQVACATCHIDARFDRLAWDLGDPTGDMLSLTNRNFQIVPAVTNKFHPMKGPMVTQTLQDIIGHEPFHWRGDRSGLEEFNPTFTNLQGADAELTAAEMQEFEDFLSTITFPPNPNRNLDNSLPTAMPLFAERTLGRGTIPEGRLFPAGNATRGLTSFSLNTCRACHTVTTGLGSDARFLSGRWQNIALGTNGEHHVAMTAMRRTSDLPFKTQQLRNLCDKNGFSLRGPVSRAGFGFLHDGRVDSLTRFVQDGFDLQGDQETADMIAFLMAFTGSDLPAASIFDANAPPGLPSRDVSAGVGFQTILRTNLSNTRIDFMISNAQKSGSRVDLIVHSASRSWFMTNANFTADKFGITNSISELMALATADSPVIFTLVPRGSGVRLALDRDEDGFFNQSEIEAAADPDNADITPETTTPRLTSVQFTSNSVRLEWLGRVTSFYRVQTRSDFSTNSAWADFTEPVALAQNPASWTEPIQSGAGARFYRVVHVP